MKSMRNLVAISAIAALLVSVSFYAGAKEDAAKKEGKKENPWVQKKDKDGIKVFVRNVEGIEFKEFLGVMTIDVPIEAVDRLMKNVPNQVNWMCDMIESKVIKDDPVNPIQYNVITAPLVSNRDVIIQTRVVRSPGKIVRYFHGIKLDSIPERKGIVRMPKMVGMWIFEALGKNRTRVTYQNLADPGGKLPAGLVNLTVVKQPYVTLRGMRKQLTGK
ncbi:MAG: hypothetical protein JW807_04215 [Spirochaetes bacterium]|nr:hypothetical protein [Spirochaetota bacterium]